MPHEKTIVQIGRSLNILGRFAAGLGQQVRLEVHGTCAGLPTIQGIMDVADHPSVAVCWNCNVGSDMAGKGLQYNFDLVKDRLGATLHVHEMSAGGYPYPQLFDLVGQSELRRLVAAGVWQPGQGRSGGDGSGAGGVPTTGGQRRA